VYWEAIKGMLQDGEPGFSVNVGENTGESLRNACCEITSRDDSDLCNLGTANLARIDSIEEFQEVVEIGTAFLLCGSLVSKLPWQEMYKVREKNRRLGLGLMGLHEWLLKRGYKYGPCDELAKWLEVYVMSGAYANRYTDNLSISRPIATRAVAPNGTIAPVAETTSGIEPITCVALKRRYLKGKDWMTQYIIDPTAKRLMDNGMHHTMIEDALTLAEDVDRRISFQEWLQRYVDHGISSTINLPPYGSALNNENLVTKFGNLLLKRLPNLRGITAYPDGSRDGQPLTRVPYEEAVKQLGVVFTDMGGCKDGVCGS
jgi:ribonucleoside-diphosphate reductase alpha chain